MPNTEIIEINTPSRRRKSRRTKRTVTVRTAAPSRPKRATRRSRNRQMAIHPGLLAYVHTVQDPWCCPPVRLGWGSYSPTQLATLTARYTIPCNADGSFAVACFPINGTGGAPGTSGAMYSSGPHGASVWASGNWMNSNPVSLLAASGRVVSSGVRVQVPLAATAVPGMLYAGSFPELRYADVLALSIDALTLSPLMRMGMGTQGAAAISLPMDPTSFSYSGQIGSSAVTPSTTTNAATTIPIICGTGFPGATNVMVEYVLNIEYQPYWQNTSSICRAINLDDPNILTVQDSGLTAEQVSRFVRHSIGFAENVAEGAANIVSATSHSLSTVGTKVVDTVADVAKRTLRTTTDLAKGAFQNTFRTYNRVNLRGALVPPLH